MQHIFDAQAGRPSSAPATSAGWWAIATSSTAADRRHGHGDVRGPAVNPDAGIWWSIVEKYKVTHMFSAPTAIRVLKKHDADYLKRYDLSSLKALWLAGEPLDEPTRLDQPGHQQAHHRQLLADRDRLAHHDAVQRRAKQATRFGSPGRAVYGYNVKLIDDASGEELIRRTRRACWRLKVRCRPAACRPVWRDDNRFVNTYWKSIPGRLIYSTFDWGIRDEDGYYFILGRTDDVINVAATAWARARSRRASLPMPRLPKWPWSALPTISRAGCAGLCRGARCRLGGR
jgi:propionyl-CoA synthetase